MKRLLKAGPLCFLAAFLFAYPATGSIDLLRAWQEFDVIASAANGLEGQDRRTREGANIPGIRTVTRSASVPRASASGTGTQSGSLSSETFTFSGLASASIATIHNQDGTGGASARVILRQIFEFDVVTNGGVISIGASRVDYVEANGGIRGIGWGVANRTTGEGVGGTGVVVGTNSYSFPVGRYRLEISAYVNVSLGSFQAAGSSSPSISFDNSVTFSNLLFAPGSGPGNPILPPDDPGSFPDAPSGAWFDPPAVSEYSFQMTSNSLFTGIFGFPPGFTNDFEVLAEGTSLGSFSTTQSVDFVELLGHGVSQFRVRNIAPLVDGSDPRAFPIQLGFNTAKASFLMLPNPGLAMRTGTNGVKRIYFAGVLVQSTNLIDWTDVPGTPVSPFTLSTTNGPPHLFWRARQD